MIPLESQPPAGRKMSNPPKNILQHVLKNSKFRVMFTGIIANLFYMGYGCILSYPAPAIPNINANRNPFHVDDNEQSWIGSLSSLGNIVGGIVCGSIADALGRKLSMITSAVLCVASLTLVSSATNVTIMYIGMFLAGVFSAINYAAVSLYSSEIATHKNRGILLSLSGTTGTLGTLSVFVTGSYIPWNWLAIFVAAFYALPPLVLVFLPESPRWFYMKGNKEAAAHGLRWFRGEDVDISTEMDVIGQSLADAPKGMSAWKDLLKRKNSMPLLIVCILLLIQAFSGNYIMSIFTVTIFKDAKVNIDANLQSVITGLFSFLGSVLCLFLIEHYGRRALLIVSTLFTAVGMGMLAAFFQVQELDVQFATYNLSWLPMLGLSLSNFMFNIGLFSVPWVFACELFSTNVRGVVQTVTNVFFAVVSFVAAKTFVNFVIALNSSGAFWFYSGVSAVGFIFILFGVKEPKHAILD